MSSLAVGATVFYRTERLRALLDSVDGSLVDRVYVADDGPDDGERAELYDQSYPFDIQVFDLETDAGVGAGRNRIATELDEDFLLLLDSDHRFPPDIDQLLTQLRERPELGGVSGNILEPEQGRLWNPGSRFYEESSPRGTTLVRTADRDTEPMEMVAGHALTTFDFAPTPMLFRRACLTDYAWDPKYVIGSSHLDFYVGHWNRTDWSFGICPSVCVPHYPGGSDEYLSNRHDEEKLERDRERFLEKWGYDAVRPESDWFDTDYKPGRGLLERAHAVYENEGALALASRATRYGLTRLT